MADMFCLNGVPMHQLLDQQDHHHDHNGSGGEDEEDEEEDVFQCGKCKQQFTMLDLFMAHKKMCPIKNSSSDPKNRSIIHRTASSDVTTLTRMVPPCSSPSSPSHMLLEPPSASLGSNVITLSESDILSLTSNINSTPLNENSNPLNSESISILSPSGGVTAGGNGNSNNNQLSGPGNGMELSTSPMSAVASQSISFPALSFVTTNSLNGTTYLVTTTSSNGASSDAGTGVGENLTISPNIVLNITTSNNHQSQSSVKKSVIEKKKNAAPSKLDVHEMRKQILMSSSIMDEDGSRKNCKLQCSFCERSFNKNFDLQQHIRCHTGEKPFQCVVCGRAFAQKSNVKKHMQTHKVWPDGLAHTLSIGQENEHMSAHRHEPQQHHRRQQQQLQHQDDVDGDEDLMETGMMEKPDYTCPYCKSCLKTYFELKTHMKTHKREKVYKCIQSTCGKMFSELDHFLEHIQIHEQEMTYRCHQCSKTFSNLNDLADHQFSHSLYPSSSHPRAGHRYYRCQKCLNKYTTPAALEHHLTTSTHHYPCPQCSKVFPCERYLRRHLVTHGSGLHECHYCEKTFKTANYLKVHLVIHTGVKPYVCNICPAAFNRRDKLKRHKLVHDPIKKFKCPFRSHTGCTKEFNRPDKLKAHMLTHSGVKPHQCGQCGRSFSRRAHLRAHFASHANTASSSGNVATGKQQNGVAASQQKGVDKSSIASENVTRAQEAQAVDLNAGSSGISIISSRPEGEILTLFDCSYCGNLFTSENDAKHHDCPRDKQQQHPQPQQQLQQQQQEKLIATPPKKKASLIYAQNLAASCENRTAGAEVQMLNQDHMNYTEAASVPSIAVTLISHAGPSKESLTPASEQ